MIYRSFFFWFGIKPFYSTILDNTFWTIGIGTFINFWNDKWVLKLKCELRMVYRSSSFWSGIEPFYSTILDNTSWTAGIGTFINLWNDKLCFTTSLANIVGLYDGVSIPNTFFQFWTGCDWNIPLSLQQIPHLFNHIIIWEEQDIPNWILDESGRFTLKSAKTFFLEPRVPCGCGKFIWSSSIMPSKTVVLWKFFHGRLPTDQHIQYKGLHICSMCMLCGKHEEYVQHLFFECSTALRIWSWVRKIFLTPQFSNKNDILSFIKSDGSPLVKFLKVVVITFSIWMIWYMRNYARFQDKINVSRAILVIKYLTCLVGNSSKSSMQNDMLDFYVIKFFGINTCTGKVFRPLPVT